MVHLNYRQCWFFHRDNVDGVFASSYIHPYDSEKRCHSIQYKKTIEKLK